MGTVYCLSGFGSIQPAGAGSPLLEAVVERALKSHLTV